MTSKNIATKHIISRQNRQEMIGKALYCNERIEKIQKSTTTDFSTDFSPNRYQKITRT